MTSTIEIELDKDREKFRIFQDLKKKKIRLIFTKHFLKRLRGRLDFQSDQIENILDVLRSDSTFIVRKHLNRRNFLDSRNRIRTEIEEKIHLSTRYGEFVLSKKSDSIVFITVLFPNPKAYKLNYGTENLSKLEKLKRVFQYQETYRYRKRGRKRLYRKARA